MAAPFLNGVIPAMVTPFTKDGAVDYEKAEALAGRLEAAGVHGLFIAGTTGSGPLMSLDERKTLLTRVRLATREETRIVAHTGTFDTATTIELTRHALEAGADAAAAVVPGYFAYDSPAVLRHFLQIAKAVPELPLLLYNIPACSGNAVAPEDVIRLAEGSPAIAGLKNSDTDLADLAEIASKAPPRFAIFNGVDTQNAQARLTGAHGTVSGPANVAPKLFLSQYESIEDGDLSAAMGLQLRINALCELLGYGGLLALFQEALRVQGFDSGYVRPPQRELFEEERTRLRHGLEELGLA
jgi:dihydrodipicolinate synthase/N-acetylneuraminate lyase